MIIACAARHMERTGHALSQTAAPEMLTFLSGLTIVASTSMAEYVLNNATLLIGDGQKCVGHLAVRQDRIQAVSAGRYQGGLESHDLAGAFLSSGMIDLMVLGGFNL